MNHRFGVCAVLVFWAGVSVARPVFRNPNPSLAYTLPDSVGIAKKNGQRYIMHRVDKGETLFSIARRYKRSTTTLKAANAGLEDAVRYDQVLYIPLGKISTEKAKVLDKVIQREEQAADKAAHIAAKAADPVRSGIHIVEKGQTLYAIARRYGISQADLRKWNNLPSDNVLIGQALMVTEKAHQERDPAPNRPEPRPAEPRPAESKPERPTSETSKPEPHPTEPRLAERSPAEPKPERPTSETSKPEAVTPKPDEVEIPRPGNDAPMPTRGRLISKTGIAERIEGPDASNKFLALHRTAPIGTLVQVRNAFNNQSVWVKVIGRLPDTGINDKILVKLSSQAFAKLSPNDARFRAEVSYIAR